MTARVTAPHSPSPDRPSRTPPRRDGVRLAHVTTVPKSLGFLTGQVAFMKARGLVITAISSPDDDLTSFAKREAVPVYAVPMARRITPGRDLIAIRQLARVFRQVRPDIVHAATPKGGLLGILAASITRVPVRVYHIRGLPMMTATGVRRMLLRWSERVACTFASQVLCVSGSVRDVAVREHLCPAEKIKVLAGGSGNGVDSTGRFDPDRVADRRAIVRQDLAIDPAAVVLGFVGRVVRDKGIVELLAAWRTLRDACPSLHLVIAGELEEEDPIPDDVRQALSTDHRVHLLGRWRDTPALYAALDMVVLPTYREGFPNVPLEASAMRLPVVATRVPGCVDAVVDGVTGTLVPVRDATALAAAIRRYVDDPALRTAHGNAGRERVVRDFAQEVIWEALYAEYVRLLDAAGVNERMHRERSTRNQVATAP